MEDKTLEEVKPNLYLNMILKDSEPVDIVRRAIFSLQQYVDGVYVTVTYKEELPKDTPLIKFLAQNKVNVSFFKWVDSFADARNFAMDQVPKSPTNFIVWIDADDVFQSAPLLPGIIKDMVTNNWAAVFFDYLYQVDLDENGNVREVLIEHKRERLIRNDDTFKWIGMLHETLIEQRQENVQKILRDDCSVLHLSDPSRIDANLDRNITILEKQAEKEKHKDPRTIVYLAKAYFDKSKFSPEKEQRTYCDLSLTLFREYLEGSGKPGEEGHTEGSGWSQERSTAWSYVAEICRQYNKIDEAISAIQNAIDEAPEFPNYYIDLAMFYIMKGDYQKGKHWLTVATSIPQPRTTIVVLPRDLKTRALEVKYHIDVAEGNLDAAEKDVEKLVEILPDMEQVKERLKIIKGINMANKAAQSVVFLGKYLEEKKEEGKITSLLKSVPTDIENEKFVAEMRHKFIPKRVWDKNEIAILCGPGFEPWSPKSIETGLGGSEEAVVYLSEELNKLGWKVTVFANPAPPHKPGDYNGVEYRNWYDLNPKDDFNVLVLWRSIGFADFNPSAKFKLVWLHDIPNNPDFTEARVDKIDKIAVLSNFHKSLLRLQKNDGTFIPMPERKVFLTSNGMPPLPKQEWKGNPYRCIYISSPDRGLVYLLKNWGQVKKEVPQAELHVFYGFNVYDVIHRSNPAREQWKKAVLDMMKQDGITYHGRIGHQQLNEEIAKSGVWAYSSDFEEISCISAMKCQALGAIPVVTDYAALKETVRNGIRVDANIRTAKGQEEYVKALVDILKDHNKQDEIRADMMNWARDYFTWDKVALKWNELFRTKIGGGDIKNAIGK